MIEGLSDIAVVFGGPSPEHDVSILTGLQAARALGESGRVRTVRALYWSKAGKFFEVPTSTEAPSFLEGTPPQAIPLQLIVEPEAGFVTIGSRLRAAPRPLDIDAAIICCHGGPGEDGTLQGALDLAQIPYSGPSAIAAALGMDKLASAALCAQAGLPTLPRMAIDERLVAPGFEGPYIVKPRFGGSSIGIEVVTDLKSAVALRATSVHLRRGAVIEPYRPELFDLQIAVRTWPQRSYSAIERPIRSGNGSEILNYVDKYVSGQGMASAARELPAVLPDKLASSLRQYAEQVSDVLGARGVNRIDFLSDGNELFFNEINTIPGSLSRHLFIEPPTDFVELLVDLATEAVRAPAAIFSVAGASGSVLRDSASIAAKLA